MNVQSNFSMRIYKTGKNGHSWDHQSIKFSVLPGALGVDEGDSTTFKGLIDEARIWHSAISMQSLRTWMSKPLGPSHPNFKTLVGYYNFDDGLKDVGINWVGRGPLAYHLRNGRNNYKGFAPLAYTVKSNNPGLLKAAKQQELFNAVVVKSE